MRSSLRTIAAVGCVTTLVGLLAVSVAAGAYEPGKYAGTTSQGEAIGFKAKDLGVKKFLFTVVADCEDATRFAVEHTDGQAPTNKRGKFEVVFTGSFGTTVLNGKLKRKRAWGHFETELTNVDGAACAASGDWSAEKQ